MKKILATIALLAGAMSIDAATVMNFARTVQSSEGLPETGLTVNVRVIIRQDAPDGAVAFAEEHRVTTSPAGVAYVPVGSVSTNGTLDELDWSNRSYWMETAVDLGSGYTDVVNQQILSVPRAIHADTASELILTSPSGKQFSVVIADDGTLKATEIR